MLRSRLGVLFLAAATVAVAAGGCREVGARHDIQEANKLYYDQKYDEAIKLYDEALASEPQLAIGWYNLGLAHLALFMPGAKGADNDAHARGAIAALQKYMLLQPKDMEARNYLLSTFIDSGHYEGAIKYFEDKLAVDPNDLDSITQLAQINQQANKFDEAIRWHKKRAELETKIDTKADAWYSIGVLDFRRLNNHPEVAGAERYRIADEGIGWLQKADEARKGHSPTLSYTNLLYRERALASDTSYARAVDTATAQFYFKQASEAAKK